MFAFIKGIIAEKSPLIVVLDCNGVGYEINIPLSTYDKLPQINESVKLKIHYTFSEMEGVRLFGFFTDEEKNLYRQLLSISKIGPKTALGILSGLSVNDIIRAVQVSDVGLLSTIPGIGKKSAERLIIELKDKVGSISSEAVSMESVSENKDLITDAENALITLGYKPFEIKKVIARIIQGQDFSSSEKLVKATIKALYKKRNI
jgi:Holliday junction DNA helicase RuvA